MFVFTFHIPVVSRPSAAPPPPVTFSFKDCFCSHTHWHQAWPKQDWDTFFFKRSSGISRVSIWSSTPVAELGLETLEKCEWCLICFHFWGQFKCRGRIKRHEWFKYLKSTFKHTHTLWPGLINICYHSQPSTCRERPGSEGEEGEVLLPITRPRSPLCCWDSNNQGSFWMFQHHSPNIHTHTHSYTYTHTHYMNNHKCRMNRKTKTKTVNDDK